MKNTRKYHIKALMLGLATVLLASSLSGCIQTEMGKALLFKEEERAPEYVITPILNSLNHEFKNSLSALSYNDQENFMVIEGAKWVTVTIEVTIQVVYTSSLLLHLIDMNESRYVIVFIVDPEERVYTYEFSSSALVNLDPFVNPAPGLWKVTVSAMGRGVTNPLTEDEYNDGYRLSGAINQPT